jgi:hypothetical protein
VDRLGCCNWHGLSLPSEEGAASAALQLANGLAIALATGVGGALIGRGTTAALLTPGLLLQPMITLAVLSVTVLAARRLS